LTRVLVHAQKPESAEPDLPVVTLTVTRAASKEIIENEFWHDPFACPLLPSKMPLVSTANGEIYQSDKGFKLQLVLCQPPLSIKTPEFIQNIGCTKMGRPRPPVA
jgi:hypothetical protein